jgi:signal recognition particle subunit SRP54
MRSVFESLSDRLTEALKKLTGRGVLRPEDVDATLREVRMALLEADVNFKVVKQFQERIRERLTGAELAQSLTPSQQILKVVHDELVQLLGANEQGLRYAAEPPTIVLLCGLQGSGKTTTAVKLAVFARREGRKPAVVALDLRRPAAVDQLRILAEREKVPFFSGQGGVGLIARQALADAKAAGADLVILDTAGRLSIDQELMDELMELNAGLPVTEKLLVADAMTGQEAVNVATAFSDAVGLDGVILTKLDGDARGGAALSLKVASGLAIRFAGVGERPQDLEVFHADRMASRILGMGDVLTLIEKAERTVDQEQAKQMERSIRSGQLTMDDLLLQFRQLRSLGSLESVLGMLPGGGKLAGQLPENPEKQIAKLEAIIQSMTPKERAHPDLIDGSRKRRIARGSGTDVTDINQLLKARDMQKQLFRQLGKGGLGALKKGGLPWSRSG